MDIYYIELKHCKEEEGLRGKSDGGKKYIYMRYHHGLGQMNLYPFG
jgi:hypothetical protein